MSSIGLPALNGFVGEFTILVGAFNRVWWWALIGAVGIVLGAAYMLWMYQRVFFGPLSNPENKGLSDLSARELVCLIPIVVLCFWIGLYPRPIFRVLEKPVNYVVSKVDPSYAQVVAQSGSDAGPAGELAGE
jgi:NADH-quinone oxidoreductase subunit M